MVRHSASSSGRAMQLCIAPHSPGSFWLSSNTPPVYLGTCVQLEEDGKRAAQACYDEHAEQVAELKLFLQATLSTQKVCALMGQRCKGPHVDVLCAAAGSHAAAGDAQLHAPSSLPGCQ